MRRLLKRSNADTKTLIVVYITVIRPILEYACLEDIERIQKRALKIIVPFSSYGEALKITGITTLYDRRKSRCDQFFRQNMNNDKMMDLFPDPYTSNYNLRLPRKFNNVCLQNGPLQTVFFPQMIFKKNSRIIT
jgi:hypothetical protein